MGTIHNPHDRIVRQSLSILPVAKDFLQAYIPADVLQQFDLDSIKIYKTCFLNEKLQEHITDIVYQTKFKDSSASNLQHGYFYTLIEHQSAADILMPFRILKYQIAIIDQHLKQYKNCKILPIVYPILFYSDSKSPYPYSLDIFDLFINKQLAKATLMQPARLVDIQQISDAQILQHKISGLLEFAQKHIKDDDITDLSDHLTELLNNVINNIGSYTGLDEYIKSILYYLCNMAKIDNKNQFLNNLNKQPLVEEFMQGTLAAHFRQEGIEQGMLKGIEKVIMAMLQLKQDPAFISKVTGVAIDEIMALQQRETASQNC